MTQVPEETKDLVPDMQRTLARSDILSLPGAEDMDQKLARSFDQRFESRYRGGMRYRIRGIRHHEPIDGLVSHGSTIDNDGDLEIGAGSSSHYGPRAQRRHRQSYNT